MESCFQNKAVATRASACICAQPETLLPMYAAASARSNLSHKLETLLVVKHLCPKLFVLRVHATVSSPVSAEHLTSAEHVTPLDSLPVRVCRETRLITLQQQKMSGLVFL